MRTWLALLLLTLTFAGCTDNNSATAPGSEVPPSDESTYAGDPVLAGAAPPTWQVGKWWRYDTPSGISTRIVTADGGDHWIVETDNVDTAYFDARSDVSTLGPQWKDDLSGSQSGTRVKFFDWPLAQDKEWTTTWDGVVRRIVASRSVGNEWSFDVYEGQLKRAVYDYNPEIGIISGMTFLTDDGNEAFSMSLRDEGDAYDGQVVRVAAETWQMLNISTGATSETFGAVPASTDLMLHIEMGCSGTGHIFFALGPAANADAIIFPNATVQGYAADEFCPFDVEDDTVIAEAPYDPDWGYGAEVSSTAGGIVAELVARTITTVDVVGGVVQG